MAKHDPDLSLVFHAHADSTRRLIRTRHAGGSARVTDLAGPPGLRLPTVMQHLTVLERAGLIASSKDGRVRTCAIQPDALSPETLPRWWGPEGFSCRTTRIDLRQGGEWVFDMIGPDGTVSPNHHLYREIVPEKRLAYALLWGENGPKHADAWATFEDQDGFAQVTLGMVFSTAAEFQKAKSFGAVELGQETLGKLDRFVATR